MSHWKRQIISFFLIVFTKSMIGNSDIRASCRTIPGLTREQLEICYRANDVTTAAIEGLDLAIRECQLQFQWHRWNCSSLSAKKRNPHVSNLLRKGYKESAFAYAISSAGVAHSVARACSQGKLLSCGCDPNVNRKSLTNVLRESIANGNRYLIDSLDSKISDSESKKLARLKTSSRWKWGGCSHNMDFGIEFSEMFLDSREKGGDIQSIINLHNNHAGRMTVSNNMQIRCKCHGMSGSCQLKTCWKSAPEFRVVGKVLKQLFRKAILVDQSNLGNGSPLVISRKRNKKKKQRQRFKNDRPTRKLYRKNRTLDRMKLENSLFYYQRSPNFCDRDPTSDIPGTIGRKCNRNGTGNGNCGSMCCGRGYNLVKERRTERCRCKFHWCCYVECDSCLVEEWISVCN